MKTLCTLSIPNYEDRAELVKILVFAGYAVKVREVSKLVGNDYYVDILIEG